MDFLKIRIAPLLLIGFFALFSSQILSAPAYSIKYIGLSPSEYQIVGESGSILNNDSGHVLGFSFVKSGSSVKKVLWFYDGSTTFPLPIKEPWPINDVTLKWKLSETGILVGNYFDPANSSYHCFVFENGELTELHAGPQQWCNFYYLQRKAEGASKAELKSVNKEKKVLKNQIKALQKTQKNYLKAQKKILSQAAKLAKKNKLSVQVTALLEQIGQQEDLLESKKTVLNL